MATARLSIRTTKSTTSARRVVLFAVIALALVGGALVRTAFAADDPATPVDEARQTENDLTRSRRTSPQERRVALQLETTVDVDFDQVPLRQAIAVVSEVSGVPVRIDEAAIRAARGGLDTPIAFKVKRLSPRRILQLLLEPVTLDWAIDGDGLMISTRDEIARRLADWTYDVDDLLREGLSPEELMRTVKNLVDPESWVGAGGANSLRLENGRWRARLTQATRSKLDSLLREIRRSLRPRSDAEALDRTLVTRVYRIDDLRSDPEPKGEEKPVRLTDDEIAEAIRRFVLPGSWRSQGGDGLLNFAGDRLLIKTTLGIHGAIDELLTSARLMGSVGNGNVDDGRELPLFERGFERLKHFSYYMVSDEATSEYYRRVVRHALDTPRTVDLSATPLRDWLYNLHATTGIRFHFSHKLPQSDRKVAMRPVTIWRTDSLASILDAVLLPLDLDWMISDNAGALITSRSDAAGSFETRVHRAREALAAGMSEQALIERIATEIEPATWKSAGARISQILPGLLVVTHNRRVQERIDGLLKTLEKPAK